MSRSFIGNEPFAVMLGDDIVRAQVPCLQQLIDMYQIHQCSIIGVQQVPDEEVSKYGIIEPEAEIRDQLLQVRSLVEKPRQEEAAFKLCNHGKVHPATRDI